MMMVRWGWDDIDGDDDEVMLLVMSIVMWFLDIELSFTILRRFDDDK
jgi:hypothetical protein